MLSSNTESLQTAAIQGDDTTVARLLADPCFGPNMDVWCAAENGHDKVVALLLADPRARDHGRFPL